MGGVGGGGVGGSDAGRSGASERAVLLLRHEGSCKDNADCTAADPVNDDSSWTSTECQARCVPDLRDPDHGMVACKDDRDCPGPLVAGSCRALQHS